MIIVHQSEHGLDKSSSHIFGDVHALIRKAEEGVERVKDIGGSRSKAYAGLVVFVVSIVAQWAAFQGIQFFESNEPVKTKPASADKILSPEMVKLVEDNLLRIDANSENILSVKNKVAAAMPIDANLAAIKASVHDVRSAISSSDKENPEVVSQKGEK